MAGLAALGIVVGCSQHSSFPEAAQTLISDPPWEASSSRNGLPLGWLMQMSAGTYETAASSQSHAGKSSLALAGSGGEAHIKTNEFQIANGSLVEGGLWVHLSRLDDAEVSVRLAFLDGAHGTEVKSFNTKVSLENSDWQFIPFFCFAPELARDSRGVLSVRLRGEGLVRIDDVQLKCYSPRSQPYRFTDGGFESQAADATLPEWKFHHEGKAVAASRVQQEPNAGQSCARIEGLYGWGCLAGVHRIPASVQTVRMQGYVRALKGEGHLQIDYVRNGVTFANTCSDLVTSDEWSFATVTLEREKAANANYILATLAAKNPTGDFVADFDDIEVIATP